MLVAVLHFVRDEEDPAGIVAAYRRRAARRAATWSLSHATADFHAGSLPEVFKVYDKATATLNTRPHAEVEALFAGFELLEPGLVQVPSWRPDGDPPTADEIRRIGFYGGVARRA